MDFSFLTLQNRVLNRIGDVSEAMRVRVKQWINDAELEIATRVNVGTLLTSVSLSVPTSNTPVNLPSDFSKEHSCLLQGDNNRKLVKVTHEDYFKAYPDTSKIEAGVPEFYLLDLSSGISTITFIPFGSSSMTANFAYYKVPVTLVNDTDVGSLPTDYLMAVELYCLLMAAELQGDLNMISYRQQKYDAKVRELSFAQNKTPDQVTKFSLSEEIVENNPRRIR